MRQRVNRTDAQRRKSPSQTQKVCNFDCIWALSPWNRHTSRQARKCSMRSEIYWFAEFCQSQCLSHLAASFIVTRAEASIAKSCDRICFLKNKQAEKGCLRVTQWRLPNTCAEACADKCLWECCLSFRQDCNLTVRFRFWKWIFGNDPSAGSPTETLLRLLLPLSDKVH